MFPNIYISVQTLFFLLLPLPLLLLLPPPPPPPPLPPLSLFSSFLFFFFGGRATPGSSQRSVLLLVLYLLVTPGYVLRKLYAVLGSNWSAACRASTLNPGINLWLLPYFKIYFLMVIVPYILAVKRIDLNLY